jgi:hypothetical protein
MTNVCKCRIPKTSYIGENPLANTNFNYENSSNVKRSFRQVKRNVGVYVNMNKSISEVPEHSILDVLEGRSEPKRSIDGDVAERLRVGQGRLTRTWLRLQDLEDWPEGQDFKFWLDYEKWDRMERQAREAGQIEGCPIGPGECHEDAPIRCGHCASEKVVQTPDMPADAPAAKAVDDRKEPPKVPDVEVDKVTGQTAMFSLAGQIH